MLFVLYLIVLQNWLEHCDNKLPARAIFLEEVACDWHENIKTPEYKEEQHETY